MVGDWEGLNLGSIPNDHMPSQKIPKFLLIGGVVQFCPIQHSHILSQMLYHFFLWNDSILAFLNIGYIA